MRPFVVVEGQIGIDGDLVDPGFLFQIVETFLLDRSIESLQMCIVVGSADSAVAVCLLGMLGEPLGELRAMIRLEHLEREWRSLFRLF